MQHSLSCSACCGGLALGDVRLAQVAHRPLDSISSRSASSLAGRKISHSHASTSGRELVRSKRGRNSRIQVDAALFEPPPFKPEKLSVQYLPGATIRSYTSMGVSFSSASSTNSASTVLLSSSRRYTLTHNDITGALQLSIGSDYNQQQVQGFYTRILRDEITAEWLFGRDSAAPAELHIYCHVSGEERWLAPPQLRNFIFRREMTLVLDTFVYADKEFLQLFPDLQRAKVYVHFQSDVQDLDLREFWGVLGDRRSWQRMPRGVLARLKLLLFGFPAVPHQRPRHSLTHQQQWHQQQQQQAEQWQGIQTPSMAPVQAAAAAATDGVNSAGAACGQVGSSSAAVSATAATAAAAAMSHQWHPQAELAVEATRPVALSLQQQRLAHAEQQQQQQQLDHPQHLELQQHKEQPWPPAAAAADIPAHEASSSSSCAGATGLQHGSQAGTNEQQQVLAGGWQQQEGSSNNGSRAAAAAVGTASASSSSNNSSSSSNGTADAAQQSSSDVGMFDTIEGSSSAQQLQQGLTFPLMQVQQQEQFDQKLPQQQQDQQVPKQEPDSDLLLDYGHWSAQLPKQAQGQQRELVTVSAAAASAASTPTTAGSSSSTALLPSMVLGGSVALQLALEQPQQMLMLSQAQPAAVMMPVRAVYRTSNGSSSSSSLH